VIKNLESKQYYKADNREELNIQVSWDAMLIQWAIGSWHKDDSIFILKVKQITWVQGVQKNYNPYKPHELVNEHSII
jgi:hypothetical protein